MSGLLHTARLLADADPRRPSEANLRRAISTAYYAVFDALARAGADLVVGRARQPRPEWIKTYRALEHRAARQGLRQVGPATYSSEAVRFASAFVTLQVERHKADYDPGLVVYRANAKALIDEAATAVDILERRLNGEERLRVVVQVLFKTRPE